MNHTIFGYPLALNVTYDQNSDKFASFGLQWVVTKHLLGSPGIVTEGQLEANSSPQNRIGLPQLIKDQLARIDDIVSFIQSHINLTEESFPNSWDSSGKANFLGSKSVDQLIVINEEKALKDVFNELKDKFDEIRELGDGQVSPTLAQLFGATPEAVEAWFSNLIIHIEQITNKSTTDVSTPLSTFRANLGTIKNFSNILRSLANAIQG